MAFKTGPELEAARAARIKEEELRLSADTAYRQMLTDLDVNYSRLAAREQNFLQSLNYKAGISGTLALTDKQSRWLSDIAARLKTAAAA